MPDTTSGAAAPASIMDLVDAYAEVRHIQGHSSYNDKTQAARAAVVAALTPGKNWVANLVKFLDAAAGEGFVLDGVDAADLFTEMLPNTVEQLVADYDVASSSASPGFVMIPLVPTNETIARLAMLDATGSTDGKPRLGMAGAEEAYNLVCGPFAAGPSLDEAYADAMAVKAQVDERPCVSRDGERFTEESMSEVFDDSHVGAVVYVGEARRRNASYFLPDPDTIIDEMAAAADDEGGEFSDGYPDVSETAKKALVVAMHRWAQAHVSDPTFFTVHNSVEHVVTAEDIATS